MALILASLVAVGWLLYEFIYTLNQVGLELEERIAFVSLWVSIIGFGLAIAGAFIAVLQFQAAQRKPDLHLWVECIGQDRFVLRSGESSFHLILENRGKAVARHVKCTLEFPLPCIESGAGRLTRISMLRDTSGYRAELWQLFRTTISTTATFVGQDEYVCYDEDSDIVGVFQIDWKTGERLEPQYKVAYQLRCEGMVRREGILVMEILTG